MKKIILSICFAFAAITFVSAQQGQGGGGNMQDRMAQMKQAYKDSLGLTDAQVQSVMDVQQALAPKRQGLRDVAEADRPAKMKELNDEMQTKLAAALKDEALAKKIMEFQARRRGGMGRGGNRPPGGGNAPQQ